MRFLSMMNVLLIDGFHWFHVFNECCCSVGVHDAGFLGLFIMNVMRQSFCDCCKQCGILCVFMGL